MSNANFNQALVLINLGCGERWHPEWTNLDLSPSGLGVRQCNLTGRLPFEESSCDAMYSAAVLEHLQQREAVALLEECHRCLKPGGAIRVGVPDLEAICRLYLNRLDEARAGDVAAERDYDWMVLELLDQMVRERSGGEMLKYFQQDRMTNEAFVLGRIGEEGRELLDAERARPMSCVTRASRGRFGRVALRRLGRRLVDAIRHRALFAMLDRDGIRALEVGRFRLSGEVHHWMYDSFSLSRVLRAAGFINPIQQSPSSSMIPEWERYHLDVTSDGRVIKPDLVFVEAVKPAM